MINVENTPSYIYNGYANRYRRSVEKNILK